MILYRIWRFPGFNILQQSKTFINEKCNPFIINSNHDNIMFGEQG